VSAAKLAVYRQKMATMVQLIRELHKLYPRELQQLFVGGHPVPAAPALAAVLEAWISSLDELRAGIFETEDDVQIEKGAVQQLLVQVAQSAVPGKACRSGSSRGTELKGEH
jgi:hypothetical protein